MCEHRKVLVARGVKAIVGKSGSLMGQALDSPPLQVQPLTYDVLEFCANPTCEKVFHAQLQEDEDAA